MQKIKRHMTHDEEFQILKMVLDKFLWIGVGIMVFGFYKLVTLSDELWYGLSVMAAGAIVLLIFITILVKEYNFLSR